MSTVDPADLDPSEFVKNIRELGEKRDQEDAERFRALEEEIIQGRSERLARRAERARSLSPEKALTSASNTPQSLRSAIGTPAHLSLVSSPVSMTPQSQSAPREAAVSDALQRLIGQDEAQQASFTSTKTTDTTDRLVGSARQSPSAAVPPSRAGTLSWQRRPTSSGGRSRPLSMVATENNAARSPRATPDIAPVEGEELTRSQVAHSLGSRDPSWFRQTPDRGVGSAAYRRQQEEDASDTGSVIGKRMLPGFLRGSSIDSEKLSSPPSESVRSTSPSRAGSVRGSAAWSDRFSTNSSISGNSAAGARSPLPMSEATKFNPPISEESSIADNETTSLGRTMSSAQSRIALDRPPSPTKGMGGFVQSAMLKRSDSVNKRWSAQAAPGLSRQSSTASNRSDYGGSREGYGRLSGSLSMPKLDGRSSILSRGSGIDPTSRPASSHSNLSNVAVTQGHGNNDGFVKPAVPLHSRSKSVASISAGTLVREATQEETSPPLSPSKRWSPTKSSWLESAINKPDSPKPKVEPPQQPSWMTEINKAKQQRAGIDMSKDGSKGLDRSGSVRVAAPSPSAASSPFGPGLLKKTKMGDSQMSERPTISSTPPSSRSKLRANSPKFSTDPFKEAPAKVGLEVAPEEVANQPADQSTVHISSSKEPGTAQIANKPPRSTSTLVSPKTKPITPPKKDFRSTLRSRQGPSEVTSKEEPEFKNIFGKLKRTQTEKYAAPDELKDNILRGKAGLSLSEGPQKAERVDELKSSLLKQKEAIRGKTLEGGSADQTRFNGGPKPPTTPEAIEKRNNLGSSLSVASATKVAGDSTRTTPEAIARQKSLREKPKPHPPEKQPSALSRLQNKESIDSDRLAERFNPALAGIIARKPSPLTSATATPRSTKPPIASNTLSRSREHEDLEGTSSAQLIHMTKGRARGPKRRRPNVKTDDAVTSGRVSLPAVQLVKPEDVLSSSSSNTMKPKVTPRSARVVSLGTLAGALEKAKPVTPTKSPILVQKISASPADSAQPQSPKPTAPAKSPLLLGKIPAAQLDQTQDGSQPSSASNGRPSSLILSETPNGLIASKPLHDGKAASPPTSARHESADEDKENIRASVKNASSLWGRSTGSGLAPTKSPIRLPTRHDEQATMENAGPYPGFFEQLEWNGRRNLKRLKEVKTKVSYTPVNVGILDDVVIKHPDFSFLSSTSKCPTSIYPMSPPLSAGFSPNPIKPTKAIPPNPPSISLKAAPQSPIPHTSDAVKLFAEFFDDIPASNTRLEVDAHTVLAARANNPSSIRTLRKHIQEVSSDGKMTSVPPQEEHVLYENSMYLCTHIFGAANGARTSETYLWAGSAVSESIIDDAQAVGRKAAKDNNGTMIMLRQGKETANFLQALGGIAMTRRGSRRDSTRRYMLCGRRHMGHIAFDEVDMSLNSLCSGFPYIISLPVSLTETKLYLWKGNGCGAEELGSARLIGMDLDPTGEIEQVDEGHETPAFLAIFADDAAKTIPRSADYWKKKASCDKSYNVRLFRVDQAPQQQTSTMPPPPPMQTKINEIAPFCQSDLEAEHVYVLDAFFEIYVIPGPLAHRKFAAFHQALLFAQEYGILAASLEDRPFVPVSTVVMDGVPRDLKAVFRTWDDRVGIGGTGALMSGKGMARGKELKLVALSAAIAATTGAAR
ncbi:hypothetical protein B0A49_01961 [Cryomyces minteri]|uniref:Uncharacterized protein n=1 Tax=Cryomyces minteri TaxID=331657 RepID=A0A4U0XNA0_9PEZI|nr:hypothetical protein B0A49_01950 [Cryomyces minteri]TKA80197.1 hypothetical protein B0A49_01911 [Cryomyces minteri]TKA80210.1 hypothetical protein B0A49_01961 [Cryomyces minteri]